MKRCTRCYALKPESQFYKNRSSPDGFSTQCKSCQDAYQLARRQKQKAATRAQILANLRYWRIEVHKAFQARHGGWAQRRHLRQCIESYKVWLQLATGVIRP